jgi:hypothetical protein
MVTPHSVVSAPSPDYGLYVCSLLDCSAMKCVLWIALCAVALAANPYESGKLISITDSRSNRVVGNGSGSVVNVTDVEYRLSVQVGDMVYVGSYWPRWRWSYAPTDFVVNDPVQVRIEEKRMYLKRPDGKELKTDIVQRIHTPQKP